MSDQSLEENVSADPLLSAFQALCTELNRPFSAPELHAAGGGGNGAVGTDDDRTDLRRLLVLAERLGLVVTTTSIKRGRLMSLKPPYMLIDAKGSCAYTVRARNGDHLITVDGATDETTALTARELSKRAPILLQATLAQRKPVRDLWQDLLWPRLKPVLWQIVGASAVLNLLALATPLFLMAVYNKVVANEALDTLNALAAGMAVIFLFEWLLRTIRGYLSAHTGARLDAALCAEITHHVLNQPAQRFEALSGGQILERLRQLDALRQFFTGAMPLLLADFLFVGVFLALLFVIAPSLAWLTTAAIPGFLLLSFISQHQQRRLSQAQFTANSEKSACLHEAFGNASTVKALGLEPVIEQRLEQRLADAAYAGYRTGQVNNLVGATGQWLQHVVGLAIIYLGARGIIAGELSIGALIAGTILSVRVLAPMRQVVGAWQSLQQVREGMARLNQLLAQPRDNALGPAPSLSRLTGHIVCENVTFRYRDDWPVTLHGIDLTVAPGTFLALVGPPGSGKSTLGKLIAGLLNPSEGRVLVDGFDVRQLPGPWLRHQIGIVPQEPQLFQGSIADNIRMGAPACGLERVVAAARFVGLHDVIQALPQGYDTELGERGAGLSVGQRQQLAIARVLVRNPSVMILDEATSALDGPTESQLLRNLKRASRGRTVVMITHRLPADDLVDHVVALHQGRALPRDEPGAMIDLEASPALNDDQRAFLDAKARIKAA